MKRQNKVSFEQLAAIVTPSSPEERERLVSAWNKAAVKKRRQWLAWAGRERRAGKLLTVRGFLREVERKQVWTREVILFANFEFEIRKVEHTDHGGWQFKLNESEYREYLRHERPYPRVKQIHLSKEERRVASPPRPKVIERVQVFQGDELLSVGISDERAEPPMEMSAKEYLHWKLPLSNEPRWTPKHSYLRHLAPYQNSSTEVPPCTFLRFQDYIRDALRTIAANPKAPLPLPPTVPKGEAERKNSPWRSRVPKEQTYCHDMLLDLQEIRQTEEAHKVKRCGCGNFFLQNTPKQRFCQPRCSTRLRIANWRRQRSTPKRRKA